MSGMLLLFLVLFLTFPSSLIAENLSCENYVPTGYDPAVQPGPVIVKVQDLIKSITALDEVQSFLELQIYLKNKWHDERLFENPGVRYDSGAIHVPRQYQNCVWVPSIHIAELISGHLFDDELLFPFVEIDPETKLVTSLIRYKLQVLCKFNFIKYPMDTQSCVVEFKPRYKEPYVLQWSPEELESLKFTTVSTFRLIEIDKSSEVDYLNRTVLKLGFTFERKIATALIGIYFPSTLIVSISFVSFWVDALAVPGRVTLIVTSILALMTQLVAVRDKSTPVSYVTAMDIWFFACLAFVSSALFEFALAYSFAIKRKISLGANSLSSTPDEKNFGIIGRVRRKLANGIIPNSGLDGLCRYLWPMAFLLFAVCYWTHYLG